MYQASVHRVRCPWSATAPAGSQTTVFHVHRQLQPVVIHAPRYWLVELITALKDATVAPARSACSWRRRVVGAATRSRRSSAPSSSPARTSASAPGTAVSTLATRSAATEIVRPASKCAVKRSTARIISVCHDVTRVRATLAPTSALSHATVKLLRSRFLAARRRQRNHRNVEKCAPQKQTVITKREQSIYVIRGPALHAKKFATLNWIVSTCVLSPVTTMSRLSFPIKVVPPDHGRRRTFTRFENLLVHLATRPSLSLVSASTRLQIFLVTRQSLRPAAGDVAEICPAPTTPASGTATGFGMRRMNSPQA